MGGWQRILRPFFAMCPRTKSWYYMMCDSWKMCALKHTALVKFITWTTTTWARSFALWNSSDIYLCLQSVHLHSNWRVEMRVLKQPFASSKYLRTEGDQYQAISTMSWERSTEVDTLACMYKLCMVHDGSEFNRSVSVNCRWPQVFVNHD